LLDFVRPFSWLAGVPRPPRITEPGLVYHLLNRRLMRLQKFRKEADCAAFERVPAGSLERPAAPGLPAYCLMPKHWHALVRAGARRRKDGEQICGCQ